MATVPAGTTTDTYEVVMTVDDSKAAQAVQRTTAAMRQLDAQWRSTIDQQARVFRQMQNPLEDVNKKIPVTTSLFGKLGDNALGAAGSVAQIVTGFTAMSAARSITEYFVKALDDMMDYAKKTANELYGIRDSMRDVMGVTGQVGKESEDVIKKHIDLMVVTGMRTQEAHDYTEDFLGAAEAYRGKLSDTDFTKLQINMARYAMAYGGDVAPYAQLAGSLLGTAAPGVGADELLGQGGEIMRLLQLGRGHTDRLATAFVNAKATLVAPEGKGLVGSDRALAVLEMAASRLGTEPEAVTHLKNFAQAVTGVVPGRGGKWKEFIRGEMGIKEGTHAEDAMVTVFDWMKKEQDAGRSLHDLLNEKGLSNKQGRDSIIGMYNQYRTSLDAQGKKVQGMKEAFEEGPQVTAQTWEAPVTEAYADFNRPELRMRRAEAAQLKVRLGTGKENEPAQIFLAEAKAQTDAEKLTGPEAIKTRGTLENMSAWAGRNLHFMGVAEYDEAIMHERAARLAEKETGVHIRTPGEVFMSRTTGEVEYRKPGEMYPTTAAGAIDMRPLRMEWQEYMGRGIFASEVNRARSIQEAITKSTEAGKPMTMEQAERLIDHQREVVANTRRNQILAPPNAPQKVKP